MIIYRERRIIVRQSSIRKKSVTDIHDWKECWYRRSRSRCVANFANEVALARQAADRDRSGF